MSKRLTALKLLRAAGASGRAADRHRAVASSRTRPVRRAGAPRTAPAPVGHFSRRPSPCLPPTPPGPTSTTTASWDVAAAGDLYRNDGGTGFTQVAALGLGAWGDFNNDGFVDFYDHAKTLYRNNGGTGSFTVIPMPTTPLMATLGMTWVDLENDGDLDLYVAGFESWPDAYYPDAILRNNGDETFSYIWAQPNDAVITPGRPATGPRCCDSRLQRGWAGGTCTCPTTASSRTACGRTTATPR